ncbi:hypothetical protein [Nocardia wallacei]|uniref:hypothetical protein n=1 Tax=Nocardia wallacei TaxID=480035 RepID=UPI0024578DD7|nr:hypothetical protein [Nocardia wallacei]
MPAAVLDDDIARLQGSSLATMEFQHDLTRDDHDVVDTVGTVQPRNAGLLKDHRVGHLLFQPFQGRNGIEIQSRGWCTLPTGTRARSGGLPRRAV